MEYLNHLNPSALELVPIVAKKVLIIEDGPACKGGSIFGFFSAPKQKLVICMKTIKTFKNEAEDTSSTFVHEAVHLGQACQTGLRHLKPFGMASSRMPLNATRRTALNKLRTRDSQLRAIEHEAFYLETKPAEVTRILSKYCL